MPNICPETIETRERSAAHPRPTMRSAVPGRPTKPASLRDRLTLQRNKLPPTSVVDRAPKAPVVQALATSLDTTLAAGGVVAAFPRDLHKTAAVLQLDPTTAAGTAAFWLCGLHTTPAAHAFAYDASTELHATVGMPEEVDWFPTESTYGAADVVDADAYELASAGGYAVQTHVTPSALRLGLEAAGCGAGPPVFAAFSSAHGVDDAGEFCSANSAVAAAAAAEPVAPTPVVDVHVVSAAPSFLLADLLHERDAAEGDKFRKVLVPEMEATIHQAALSVARQVRTLAERRILALDVNSTSVAFYPKLAVAEDGESLEATGYGYESAAGTVTKGVPKVAHFGAYATKFRPSVSAYHADAAYATSVLSLLASTRAVHGARAMELLKFALEGRDVRGAALPEPDLPEAFDRISLPAALARAEPHAETFASALVGLGKGPTAVTPHAAEQLAAVLGGERKEDAAVLPRVVEATTGVRAPDCCVFAPRCEEEDAEVKRVRDALAKAAL